LENQRLIKDADVTVNGELIKVWLTVISIASFIDGALSTSFQHSHGDLFMWIKCIVIVSSDCTSHVRSRLMSLSEDGPPRLEINIVEPKPGVEEQAVWQRIVSHLQVLSFRGAPNRSRPQIASSLAGKLGPLLVGCEVRKNRASFIRIY
jgi:hypothetical protein